jgi:hypothetical protein
MRVGDKIAPLHHPILKPANLPDFFAVARISKPVEAHAIGDNTAWALGQWTQTFTGPDNTVKEVHGDSVVLAERDGDAWKWRLLIVNVASAPAATGTATPVPNDNTE